MYKHILLQKLEAQMLFLLQEKTKNKKHIFLIVGIHHDWKQQQQQQQQQQP